MTIATDFAIEASAGILGVFSGVVLALWSERRRQTRERSAAAERSAAELADVRGMLLGSVVKNTSEAKRLRSLLAAPEDPYVFQVAFEAAVWDATQSQFVRLAPLDERVLFTRFFEQVGRLVRLVEFHRHVRAEVEVRATAADRGDTALLAGLQRQLLAVAEDVRLDGIVLVTDHGEPAHRRLLGLQAADPDAAA